MAHLQVRRLGYALGAEVRGIDLGGPIDDAAFRAIREAWLEHILLCFPGQTIEKQQLLSFAARFGPLEEVLKQTADPDAPNVTLLTNKATNGKPAPAYKNGQFWHSDKSMTTRPTSATFVLAKEIPEVGGDTMFANMYQAYDALSPAMQALLEPLEAIHDAAKIRSAGQDAAELAGAVAARASQFPPAVHPVVITHPETGRKALYVSERVTRFIGMSEAESRPLLDFLNEHAVAYEFTYRHRWTANDLVMWDNRCSLHIALCDYDLQHDIRHMFRCAASGAPTGYRYEGVDRDPALATPR